jgi:oxygen-dependent protoporphyrinogen oxidase
MSVGEYFTHRLGRGIVDKIMSAGIHGMTGGDIWKLSMAGSPWPDLLLPPGNEPMTHVRVRQVDYEMMTDIVKDKPTFDLATDFLDANAIWFREGFCTLTDALGEALMENPNVTIKTGEPVTSVDYDNASDRVLVRNSVAMALSQNHPCANRPPRSPPRRTRPPSPTKK